jgi:hypothetical protein
MKLPYKIKDAGSMLYRAGVSYHASGTTKAGKVSVFDFFQCDTITNGQLGKIREYCPDVQVAGVHHKFAPELKMVHVLFPKSAWYRAKMGVKP